MNRISVMQFETANECKNMAVRFHAFVSDAFDEYGYELNERIVWSAGKTLLIDKDYLNNWIAFESAGYGRE